jgi:predicted dehydrogenase
MKALFIGLGGVGQRHLRILKTIYPNIKIGAVRNRGNTFEISDDLQINKNINIIKKYNIFTFPTISKALEFAPNFAIVANPTSFHVSATTELIKNKIPVLLEKPISSDSAGLKNLLNLSKKNKTVVMVGYMMRFNPCAIQLKDYVNKNVLGNLYSVIITINSFMPEWHKYECYNEFYAGQKKLGGGVVLTEIHELDILSWLFGKPKKIFVVGGKLSSLDLDVEDTAGILMEQSIGGRNIPISINMSFVQRAPIRKFLILGEKGSLEWNILKNTLKYNNFQDNIYKENNFLDFDRNQMFSCQLLHFIDCLLNNKMPITSLENVIEGHMTALLIKKKLDSLSNKF